MATITETMENLQAVAQTAGSEVTHATLLQKTALGALACSLTFEWITGNEALMGFVGGNVLEATHNALATAAATGASSFTEQAVFGLVATAAVAGLPRTTAAIQERFFPARPQKDDYEQQGLHVEHRGRFASLLGRFPTAFAFGTAVPTLARSAAGERTPVTNAKEVLTDAALIGLGVAAIAGAAAGVTNAGEALGMQQQAQIAVDVMKNPLTYASLFGVKMAIDWVKSRFQRRRPEEVTSAIGSPEIEHKLSMELYRSPDSSLRVMVLDTLNEKDKEAVWQMIQQGFRKLNTKAGEKQDMTRAEFDEDVGSPNVYHYVAYNEKDEPVGFLNLHWGLDNVRWIPDAVKNRMAASQESVNPGVEPAYVGTLVVPETLRASDIAPALIRASYAYWKQSIEARGDIICFFDCAQANNPKLPRLLQFLARPSTRDGFPGVPLEMHELGSIAEGSEEMVGLTERDLHPANVQHYFSMQLS